MHDDPKDPPGDDPDRAAILARRQRFIAIALSGLASGVGCAQPCLKTVAPGDGGERGHGARPEACLSVAAPESEPIPDDVTPPQEPSPEPPPPQYVPQPPPAEPRVCLKIMKPRDA